MAKSTWARQAGPTNKKKFSMHPDGIYQDKRGINTLILDGVRYDYNPADKPIGTGGFGSVYRSSNGFFAIKVFTPNEKKCTDKKELISDLEDTVYNEAKVLAYAGLSKGAVYGHTEKEIKNETTQQLEKKNTYAAFMPMPLYNGPTLQKALVENSFSTIEKLNLILLSCLAVYKMHLQGIVHRDIKPDNFIYRNDKNSVSVIDYGFSSTDPSSGNIGCGTPHYCAPEAFAETANNHYSDYVSLSRVLSTIANYSDALGLIKKFTKLEDLTEPTNIIKAWRDIFYNFIDQLSIAKEKKDVIKKAYEMMSHKNPATRAREFKFFDFIFLINEAATELINKETKESSAQSKLQETINKINIIKQSKKTHDKKFTSYTNKRRLQLDSRALLEKMHLFNNNLIAVMEDKLHDTKDLKKQTIIKQLLGTARQQTATNIPKTSLYAISNKIADIRKRQKVRPTDVQKIYKEFQTIKIQLQSAKLQSEPVWNRITRFFSDTIKQMFDWHTNILSSQYIYSTHNTLTRLEQSIDNKCRFFGRKYKNVISQDAPANCPKPKSN